MTAKIDIAGHRGRRAPHHVRLTSMYSNALTWLIALKCAAIVRSSSSQSSGTSERLGKGVAMSCSVQRGSAASQNSRRSPEPASSEDLAAAAPESPACRGRPLAPEAALAPAPTPDRSDGFSGVRGASWGKTEARAPASRGLSSSRGLMLPRRQRLSSAELEFALRTEESTADAGLGAAGLATPKVAATGSSGCARLPVAPLLLSTVPSGGCSNSAWGPPASEPSCCPPRSINEELEEPILDILAMACIDSCCMLCILAAKYASSIMVMLTLSTMYMKMKMKT
mmetsp:Transcript_175132/g.561653  ORF Transcript_175132/g.561653 Transcript_175132/m.561653 type:complete len:283 (-) Transcript_175132:1334-2182(-)